MVEARSKPVSQDSSRIRFQNIFEQIDLNQRKTSIVSTLGPATYEPDQMSKLIEAGSNIIRLNFAFGDHKVSQVLKTAATVIHSIKQGAHPGVAST